MKYLVNYIKYESEDSVILAKNNYNAVVLITAHSSKGKEYPVVINSLNKYNFNSLNVEEEMRLLFVSITRAKEELYITYNMKEIKNIDIYDILKDVEFIKYK